MKLSYPTFFDSKIIICIKFHCFTIFFPNNNAAAGNENNGKAFISYKTPPIRAISYMRRISIFTIFLFTHPDAVYMYFSIYRIEPIRFRDVEIQVLYRRLAPQILVQGISALQG